MSSYNILLEQKCKWKMTSWLGEYNCKIKYLQINSCDTETVNIHAGKIVRAELK